jgi:dTDP-4-amino-4,6-dideoxygalactose transaminase
MNESMVPQAIQPAYTLHLSTPDVGKAEEDAVVRALRSGWVAPLGPELALFEQELATVADRQHALAVSSGTAALHLALLCSGVGPGDLVLCSTLTFVATANAITYIGARPYFVDCDETGNMDPELLAEALLDLAAKSAKVAAVLVVDMLGKVANYEAICAIAEQYALPVVSDAAESLGSLRGQRPAGSFGNCAVFSFNGNKIITTSGGGVLLCDDKQTLERARYLASQARQPVIHYEHTETGYNYRLSNLLAALGRAQLSRLPEFVAGRQQVRSAYRELCSSLTGVEIFGGDDRGDNCWLTGIVINPELAGFTASSLAHQLRLDGIETRPMWKPMHLQPLFACTPDYPRLVNGTSERFYEDGIVLPSSPHLSAGELGMIMDRIETFAAAVGSHTEHTPGGNTMMLS